MTLEQKYNIVRFIEQSNEIEGIYGPPNKRATEAAYNFIFRPAEITIYELETFQAAIAERNRPHNLRDQVGMDVRVGNHTPPPGGHQIRVQLEKLLVKAAISKDPQQIHCAFETLHPFMDGNGRTGRALWAWQMNRLGRDPFDLHFLHRFYYQSLDAGRAATAGALDHETKIITIGSL